jgi:hypothetical protein
VGALALLALCAPGTALAGFYSWSQPGDFTGANPEQKYGQPSWSYSSTGGGSVTGSSGGVTMTAGLLQSATVTWHDPFPPGQPVTVTNSSSISNPLSDLCVGGSLTLSGVSNGQATGNVSLTLNGGATVSGGSCTANVSIGIGSATPTVTVSNPSNGSTFTNGLPQFSGTASTAFNASNAVTVRVFSGGSTSSPLAQTLTATAGPGGAYSVVPSGTLANGLYTVQASQDDPLGQTNYSVPVSFYLNISGPGLTLNSLGSKPLLSSSPTFTGRAGTRAVDSKSVQIQIYSGSSATGPVVQQDQGSVNSDGSFSVHASSPLADGPYTAVAGQAAGSTRGFSSPMTFRIKAHAPALTLAYPVKGGWDLSRRLTFLGQAGTGVGDTPSVVIELWKGKRAKGHLVGKFHIPVRGPNWSAVWPKRLPNGPYTVRVMQTDDAGHTTLTAARTFSAVTSPTTVGLLATVNRSGRASIPINCLAPPGSICTGTVLVLTSASFRTTSGGPAGRLRILYAYVSIPTGQTKLVTGRVPGFVRAVLRGGKSVTVRVKTSLTWSGGTTHASAANRRLKIE